MKISIVLLLLGVLPAGAQEIVQKLVDAPSSPALRVWPSEPPRGCPFEQSRDFAGLAFTGRQRSYTGADTWYPSWAADGKLYSPWTDGQVENQSSTSGGKKAVTGQAVIEGDDPLNLTVTPLGTWPGDPTPYEGRYPCGSLVHEGVWYYGTYCLHPNGQVKRDGIPYNWPWLGPFVGFRWSNDLGKTWNNPPTAPGRPLFGESALNGEPVKIGAPHFVDFGRAMQHSPDGKAYLAAQGASRGPEGRRYAYNSWITADEVYLLRVKPSVQNMNDAGKYEFYCGDDAAGQAAWTADFKQIKPIAAWPDNMGCVTMTYFAPLKRYILCVTDGGNTVSRYNTYLLESPRSTGPWRLITYMKHFGEQAYFVNVPSKFIAGDGRSFFLCYAANFSSGWGGIKFVANPPGSRYAMCLQEVKLLGPEAGAGVGTTPLVSVNNIARIAQVTVSSTYDGYSPAGLTDGIVDGFPGRTEHEWASKGEQKGAFVKLTWTEEQKVSRVWLFDRP
ncbi:MAG: hypothetical protein ABSH20_13420, partial [Tepidisphaeraceae bacterium]